MESYGHIMLTIDIPVHKRNMLLLILVVVERDDLEITESGWKISDSDNLHANMRFFHAAIVTLIPRNELLDLGY